MVRPIKAMFLVLLLANSMVTFSNACTNAQALITQFFNKIDPSSKTIERLAICPIVDFSSPYVTSQKVIQVNEMFLPSINIMAKIAKKCSLKLHVVSSFTDYKTTFLSPDKSNQMAGQIGHGVLVTFKKGAGGMCGFECLTDRGLRKNTQCFLKQMNEVPGIMRMDSSLPTFYTDFTGNYFSLVQKKNQIEMFC